MCQHFFNHTGFIIFFPCSVNVKYCIILLYNKCCWCDIIVVNVHAPTEHKHDDSKDNFCEELEQVFDHLPKYDMKILLGDFDAKLVRRDVFKLTSRVKSLRVT